MTSTPTGPWPGPRSLPRLRATRDRLQDPATFAEEAARIARPAEPSPPVPPPPGADLAPEALLDLIVQQSPPTQSARAASPQGRAFGAFLDQITAPHALREDPRQAELVAGAEAMMARSSARSSITPSSRRSSRSGAPPTC